MATWNELMELRIRELEQKTVGFSERFDAVDRRFDAVDKRFDAVDRRFDAVDRRLDAVDTRLDAMERRFDEMPTRTDLKAFMEELSSQVKAAAEGYGANLDALRRDIKALSTQIATKDRDRDLVLKDHSRRLRALERLENRRRLQSKQASD